MWYAVKLAQISISCPLYFCNPKIYTCGRVSEAKIYSSKIAKAGLGYDEIPKKLWKSLKLKFFENPTIKG